MIFWLKKWILEAKNQSFLPWNSYNQNKDLKYPFFHMLWVYLDKIWWNWFATHMWGTIRLKNYVSLSKKPIFGAWNPAKWQISYFNKIMVDVVSNDFLV